MKKDLKQADRILVRGVNWAGDTILTYPAVENLKKLFPRSHVAVLVADNLVDLWKTFPYVDEIIPFQAKKGFKSIWEDLNFCQVLKERSFDLALIFPRSFRSAFHMFLARVPIRIGYRDEGRSLFLTHGIPRKERLLRIHRIHYYLNLLTPLGTLETHPLPRIFLREEDRKWAECMLENAGLLDGSPLVGMIAGATYGLAKCWYPDRLGELGRRLVRNWKSSILLFGKEGEQNISQEILGHFRGRGVDLTGKTNLLQLAALLERCQVLVTNDTGTMHVAAAVGTPVVALFGPTDPTTAGPWGDGHTVVKKDVPCSPCLKRVCPTDHQCMELITVEDVEEAVDKKLQERI